MRWDRLSQAYKMVFIDLDGTTLTSDKKITPRTRQVIERLDSIGIPVVITTGRSIYSVRNFYSYLQLSTPVITLNGTVVYEQLMGKLQSYKQLSEDMLLELIHLFSRHMDIDNFMFEGLEDYYVLQSDQELLHSFVEVRRKHPLVIDNGHRFNEPITNLLVRPRDNKKEVHQWLLEQTDGKVHFVNTEWNWIEGLNPSVNKGTAITEIAAQYGVSVDQVVAFGDEWNDIEMLQVAGLGIAMENGSRTAKEVADRIAPSNDREGVASILEELFAEQLESQRIKNR